MTLYQNHQKKVTEIKPSEDEEESFDEDEDNIKIEKKVWVSKKQLQQKF
jgi:hypothetical protein